MYEIVTVCLDDFIASELSRLYGNTGYNFRINNSVSNLAELTGKLLTIIPDLAIIDCDNADQIVTAAVGILKSANDLVKIILVGDSTKSENCPVFAKLLGLSNCRFYEKTSFIGEYLGNISEIKSEIENSYTQSSVRNEAFEMRETIYINNLLDGYFIVNEPTLTYYPRSRTRLLAFESFYILKAGIALNHNFVERKPSFALWTKMLRSNALDFFNSRYDSIVYRRPDNLSVAVIIRSPNGDDPEFLKGLYNDCVDFVKYINSNSMFKINIGVSNCSSDPNSIHECFIRSSYALSSLVTTADPYNKVVLFSDLKRPIIPDFAYIQKIKNDIISAMAAKDIKIIEETLDETFNKLLDNGYGPNTIVDVLVTITSSCSVIYDNAIWPYFVYTWDVFGSSGFIYDMFDANEIKILLKNLIFGLIESEKKNTASKQSILVRRIKKTVEDNFDDPGFTVEQIADAIFMNYNYICSAFKKETGSTINQYIKNRRMSRAIELMHSGERDITSLSGKVGFSDSSYFSKCFKQYFGVTPKTYIKQRM
ncbi:MAG: helix-turn-helix transcriptional regulator [Clostridia bacterium]|nr:helix-turn-helix transcriptional regulator [Clostridia bacterium]